MNDTILFCITQWAIAFNMCTPPIEDSGNPQGAGNFEAGNPQGAAILRLEICRCQRFSGWKSAGARDFEAGNPQGASDFEAGNLQVPAILRLEICRCQRF